MRRRVDVFEFSPDQLQGGNTTNSFGELVTVDAFRKLKQWSIPTAIAVGAIKEWDCEAKKTSTRVVTYADEIAHHGGSVQYVVMDEPLFSGLGLNKPICNLTIEEAADRTVAFVHRIRAYFEAQGVGSAPAFVDTEPYPSVRLDQHEAWVNALITKGFRPAAYHLDIAIAQVDRRPDVKRRFASDLRNLKTFVEARKFHSG